MYTDTTIDTSLHILSTPTLTLSLQTLLRSCTKSKVALMIRSDHRTLFFFFFQAEDGIRDYKVTGVQTCALPIYLPRAFVEEDFEFHGRVLSGTPQLRPRWKRAVDETSAALGEAVGKLYVQRYFPPSEKARAEAMVRNLLAAFAVRIDRLEWMAPETRARAKAKLTTLKGGVGYPDKWRGYGGGEGIRGRAVGQAQPPRAVERPHNHRPPRA